MNLRVDLVRAMDKLIKHRGITRTALITRMIEEELKRETLEKHQQLA
jgi:hypothetical protein